MALPFFALPPCRLVDTRGNAPLTGGFLPAATVRSYTLTGVCSLPANAQAISLNATVVKPVGPGFLTLYPEGGTFPPVSTLNYLGGDVIVNAAVVPLSGSGGISMALGVSGGDVILDTNGYYAAVTSGIVTGTALVNVSASGVVNVTPVGLGLPADTLTRNPVALRASAWTGTTTTMTSPLVASLGLFNGSSWPVRVYDPTGVFTIGPAVVQLVVMLDPP